jgi:murein DD-endopeptidase MepM/ murein hydrolase activator NlpD
VQYVEVFEEGAVSKDLELAEANPSYVYTIKKGDNLRVALVNLGIEGSKLPKIIEGASKVLSQKNVYPGTKVVLEKYQTTSEGMMLPELISIVTNDSKVDILPSSNANQYVAKQVMLPLTTKTKFVSGTISGSLFASAKNAGASSKVISDFINIFAYVVDFQRDVKFGDNFKILYEYQTTETGDFIKNPTIVYASLTSHGEEKSAYRHATTSGKMDYYDTKGQGIKRALLATPINGARISSTYGMRKDPFHGYSRMHKGLDYSAPVGTAILAAGDGVVQFAKTQSYGYGKHVKVKHNGTYSTLYAHMSKFASDVKSGVRVKQGQVIGYVGTTGRSKGPHLHYEVIEKGVKVNPAKVRFPKSQALKGTELANFKSAIRKMDTVIAELEEGNPKVIAQLGGSVTFSR